MKPVFFEFRFVEVGGHVRAYESRRDGVYRHAFLGHLLRQRLRRRDHAAFGRRIVGLSGQSLDSRQRDDVDDAAETFDQHVLQQRARDVVESSEAGIHYRVPLLRLHPHHQSVAADARVVHHHLDDGSLVPLLPRRDRRRGLFARGHVEPQGLPVAARGADAFERPLGFVGVRAVVDEYVVAAPGQLETYLAAYAPASAGDERIFRRFGHACCLRKFSMAAISRYLGVSSMNLGTMRRMSSYSCRVWADSSAAHSR